LRCHKLIIPWLSTMSIGYLAGVAPVTVEGIRRYRLAVAFLDRRCNALRMLVVAISDGHQGIFYSVFSYLAASIPSFSACDDQGR